MRVGYVSVNLHRIRISAFSFNEGGVRFVWEAGFCSRG